jgi:hypothetical protein
VDKFKGKYHAWFSELSQSRRVQRERELYTAIRVGHGDDSRSGSRGSDSDMHIDVAARRGTPRHRSGVAQ